MPMNVLVEAMPLWFIITALPLVVVTLIALARIRLLKNNLPLDSGPFPHAEILLPVKGVSADQEVALQSLLGQSYPNYRVTFIVESEDDPGTALLSRLCQTYAHASVVVGKVAKGCAQKNQNLITGLETLRSDTEIVVFCDSTNVADRDWLKRFTGPLRRRECEVVTTFRAFRPEPETLAGVSQAIYASFVLSLILVSPRPWGGGTAVRREVLDRLNIIATWSQTVVDDLVLGNLLDSTGIRVVMDPRCMLTSPLKNQTISGFLSYLDRQILFPKFTNPRIWFATLVFHLNLTAALLTASFMGFFYLFGFVSDSAGIASWLFLAFLVFIGFTLRSFNPLSISVRRWMLGFLPCVCLAAFVFLRSVFRNYIDWHGRRYFPGKAGMVLDTRCVKS